MVIDGHPAAQLLPVPAAHPPAGLLPTLVEASNYTTHALQLLEQQPARQYSGEQQQLQQQPAVRGHDRSAVAHLAFACISLYDSMVLLWPGKAFVGPAVGACAEPVCGLVLAVLALDASANASSSSSQCRKPPIGDDLAQLQAVAALVPARLVRRLCDDFQDTHLSARIEGQVAQRLGSGSVFKVVLAALAVLTGILHNAQQQRQQLQQLPKQYHINLLALLGISWRPQLAADPDLLVVGFNAPLLAAALALHCVMQTALAPAPAAAAAAAACAAAAAGDGTGSSGSSSGAGSTGSASSTSSGRPEATAVVSASPEANTRAMYAALLLTVLEYALLQEGPGELVAAAYVLMQMLRDEIQADEAVFRLARFVLVEPVFLQLAPALLRTYREGWPDVKVLAAEAAGDAAQGAFAFSTEAALPQLLSMLLGQGEWPLRRLSCKPGCRWTHKAVKQDSHSANFGQNPALL